MKKPKLNPNALLKAFQHIEGLNLVILNRQSFLKELEDFLIKRKFMSLKDFKRIQDKYQPERVKK